MATRTSCARCAASRASAKRGCWATLLRAMMARSSSALAQETSACRSRCWRGCCVRLRSALHRSLRTGRSVLSRLPPALGAAPESKLQPLRLQRAVSQALLMASKAGLTACAIDDLHFADDASVESLLAVDRRRETMRWLVGARTAEMPRRLLEWLERTESNEVARIELAPLDVSAIETLLPRLRCLTSTRTRGPSRSHATPAAIRCSFSKRCPRLLAQDATALKGAAALLPAPGSVGQLIERRLQKLSRDALKLARVAALAGQDFSVASPLCAECTSARPGRKLA